MLGEERGLDLGVLQGMMAGGGCGGREGEAKG